MVKMIFDRDCNGIDWCRRGWWFVNMVEVMLEIVDVVVIKLLGIGI